MGIVSWVKRNKFTALLLVILFYFLFGNNVTTLFYESTALPLPSVVKVGEMQSFDRGISLPYSPEAAPAPDVTDRLVVEKSHLSLLVKDVSQTLQAVKDRTTSLGGYMVETNLSSPQGAASGQITLRIPNEKLDEALVFFRSLSAKVVSENLKGTDVTDEYVDIDARLQTLEKNKARFEEIMEKAEDVNEILRVQREIMNLQTQIDNLKGRQNYLEKTAQMSKVTLYLSTDELSLPYAPAEPWRPTAIFKRAVRSLIGNLQNLGSLTIWVAVYSVVWVPILIAALLIRSRLKKKEKII